MSRPRPRSAAQMPHDGRDVGERHGQRSVQTQDAAGWRHSRGGARRSRPTPSEVPGNYATRLPCGVERAAWAWHAPPAAVLSPDAQLRGGVRAGCGATSGMCRRRTASPEVRLQAHPPAPGCSMSLRRLLTFILAIRGIADFLGWQSTSGTQAIDSSFQEFREMHSTTGCLAVTS